MSLKQIKWAILLVPTITVLIWEKLRHTQFLLEYIPMHTGNWLTPVIIFIVTMVVVRKLFNLLERILKQLEEERAMKKILEEREKIARQLHDGIAQSIFLISVRLNKLETQVSELQEKEDYQKVKKTVKHLHQDVRQAIYNLRNTSSHGTDSLPWQDTLQEMIQNFQDETGLTVEFKWELPETILSSKEKVELYACIKEGLMNAHKHANCNQILIQATITSKGWMCVIEDDGLGFNEIGEKTNLNGHGIDIMYDRAKEMHWELRYERDNNRTKLIIVSEK